jgi:invasion protein IalB
MRHHDLRLGSLCLGSLSLGLLFASIIIGTAMPVEAQESTTATYEDWVLQCQVQPGPPAQKTCDIAQVTQVQGRPLSRLAIPHPQKGQPVKLVIQVPVNVALHGNVRIQASDADPGLTAPFDRCIPVGCFAEFDLRDDVLRKFRNATGAGKLTFTAANNQPVAIPVSFKGFGPAFDALAKE